MVKYDEGFKQRVVDVCLADESGYRLIAKRFDVPSKANVGKRADNRIILDFIRYFYYLC